METTPFWHEAAPPEAPSGTLAPERTDTVIVGAGYTGLSCALALAEAGRHAVVLEKGPPGAGASTRNGGMIGWGHRSSAAKLAKRYGQKAATEMMREARLSLEFTSKLIESLPGDAMHQVTGRFVGAGSTQHFDKLRAWAADEAPRLDMQAEIVPRTEQGRYIATRTYHGGIYMPQHGGVHPALFHKALLKETRAKGALVVDHCPVTRITGTEGAWNVYHAQGVTRARNLVYAGNGYTGGGAGPFKDMAQRLIPIPSYIIATEPLGNNRISDLFPTHSMIVETRSVHSYFRPDPWRERILYGGRASLNELPERASANRMRDIMLSIFPDLGDVRLTHSWKGFVAFTFDGAPHVGQVGGVWHACGYNGSGVAMAPYLGWRVAQKLLGTDQGTTAFDPAPFARQPLYGGNPWFLGMVEAYMRLKDLWQGVAAIKHRP